MKGGTYTMTLAKIQVRGIFRMRDIRLDELQYGGRKPRWMDAIQRRSYSVYGANALWHIDGHHKLIR